MSRKAIRSVIVLAAISLLGIVSIQIYWFNRAYTFEEQKFEDNVFIALNTVAEKIYLLKTDNAEIQEPVKQLSNNYFVVQINDTLHPYLLENLLIQEFKQRNLAENFEYAIYDCFTDSIVFGKAVDIHRNESEPAHYLQNIKWERDGHYFGVYFPEKSSMIFSNLDAWIYTSFLLLIIIIFFAYTLFVILKQKKLSEVRNDFINNMTHELKTPIATIGLTGSALANPSIMENPEKLKQYVGILSEESNRLKNLVDKVLQASNAESGSMPLNKVSMNIDELVQDVCQSFGHQVQGITFNLDLQSGENMVEGDRFHLSNVIYNLVENAVKYCTGDPVISISTRSENNQVILEIQDNGIGIAKEHLKKIFEKFYRVPKGNIYETKGYGLGLFYVNEIVKKHNGRITAASDAGHGTKFTITLPKN
jgi:two-component system phosphate regulon sensor histidine kinase PhoR